MKDQAVGCVLLLAGNEENLPAVVDTLTRHGYQCLVAPHGEAGIECATQVQPDVILLATRAPQLDGQETCRLLKADAATREIPALVVAFDGQPAGATAGDDAEGVDYVRMLGAPSELLEPIRTRIELSRLRRALERERANREHAETMVQQQHGLLQTMHRQVESALRERVKELNCLYRISRLAERSDASLDEILQGIVELIPPAWQFPEATGACIYLDDQEFRTPNFRQTAHCQAAAIKLTGAHTGTVEVCYLEPGPSGDEGPFLAEERDLLDAIAEEVGRIVNRARAEAERKQAEAILKLRLRLVEIAAAHSLDELMQRALDEIGELTRSPIGFYHFVEPDQKTLSLQAWSTRTLEEFCRAEGVDRHYSLDQAGVWVDCVHQRAPVIHNDYPALQHRKGLPPGHAEVRRELVVPIMRDGRIVSILGVGNKPVDYDQTDVALVEFVADLVSSVVERKRADEQLHAYRLQLESQNQELDAFAHTVAHDLKNPVGIIIGLADSWLEDYEATSVLDAEERLEFILRAGLKIDSIIESLMLLSGIRKKEIVPEPLDMSGIVREAIASVRVLARERQAQITLIEPAAWPAVAGYAPWIEQVWVNYISNAIKYGGQPPRIEIGVDPPADQPAAGTARFWARDNGAGLTPEEQARVFTPFTRLAQVKIQGYGMGLSIVQRIVEKLGGEVGVESSGVPGRGSTFYFTLPLAPAPSP